MDAKDVVLHQHDAVWCRGDLSVVDELFAEDFVGRHPGAPDWIGRRAVKDVVTAVRTGFPDFKEVVEEVIIAGEKVVTRFTRLRPGSTFAFMDHSVEGTPAQTAGPQGERSCPPLVCPAMTRIFSGL